MKGRRALHRTLATSLQRGLYQATYSHPMFPLWSKFSGPHSNTRTHTQDTDNFILLSLCSGGWMILKIPLIANTGSNADRRCHSFEEDDCRTSIVIGHSSPLR